MLRPFKWLHTRVPIRYWAWIHAFLALGIGWGSAIALNPPPSYDGVVNLIAIFRMGLLCGLGALVACVGLIMTRAYSNRTVHKGLWIELVGTILLGGGPLQYLGIQVGYLVSGEFDQRYALAWFAYALGAFIVVRFAIVIPALQESSRKVKLERRRVR